MDHYYLDLAYHYAVQNSGNTSPNPSVGAVIVKDGRIIGAGYHLKAGEDHAEIAALKRAGSEAKGATLYCSLEPCCHHGKTPPCAEAVIQAGISRVVFGAIDQNPTVRGGGCSALQAAGLTVDRIVSEPIQKFYEPFFKTFELERPFVTAKVAATSNGIISPADRNSRWITNESSLAWVHHLRAQCDAIIVGADTVILDRPHLTVRAEGILRKPARIVMDARFKLTPDDCSLLENDSPILVCGAEIAPENRESVWNGTHVQTYRFRSIEDLLRELLKRGMRRILIEGGQKIFTIFHSAGLIDEYILMIAPRLLTGRHFLNILGGAEQSLSETFRYEVDPPLELDGDVVLRLRKPNTAKRS